MWCMYMYVWFHVCVCSCVYVCVCVFRENTLLPQSQESISILIMGVYTIRLVFEILKTNIEPVSTTSGN